MHVANLDSHITQTCMIQVFDSVSRRDVFLYEPFLIDKLIRVGNRDIIEKFRQFRKFHALWCCRKCRDGRTIVCDVLIFVTYSEFRGSIAML